MGRSPPHVEGNIPIRSPSQLPVNDCSYPFSGNITLASGFSILSIKSLKSYCVLAIPLIPSKDFETRKTPLVETKLCTGLRAYKPALLAGWMTEPPVSVPMESGENPADTPTADPEEEPPVGFGNISIGTGRAEDIVANSFESI